MFSAYCICLKLKNRSCLVVGGGQVAERKVKSLLAAGALITVVSPAITDSLEELAGQGCIKLCRRNFKQSDIKGSFLIIAATDDHTKNREIAGLARKQKILVNVADSPEESDFFVPAHLNRGDLSIAIATNGKMPALSKKIQRQLEVQYGSAYGPYVHLLEKARKTIFANTRIGLPEKRRLIEKLLEIDMIPLLNNGKHAEAERILTAFIKENGL